jgi:hypothetical protein
MSDLAGRVLGYVDKPWKIGAVAALAVIAVVAVTAWEMRAQIAEKILEGTVTPRLEPERFPAIAQTLLAQTHADAVVLSRISLAGARLVNIDGRRVNDPAWRPPPEPRTMFASVTPEQAVDIIAGQVVCENVPLTDHHRIDVALGLRRRCIVGVPPVLEVLVGALTIGWETPPLPALESGYKLELQRLAMKLATW